MVSVDKIIITLWIRPWFSDLFVSYKEGTTVLYIYATQHQNV